MQQFVPLALLLSYKTLRTAVISTKYLGLNAHYPIFLSDFNQIRQFCVKSPILNILKICLGGDAQTERRTDGRTDMRKPKNFGAT